MDATISFSDPSARIHSFHKGFFDGTKLSTLIGYDKKSDCQNALTLLEFYSSCST
jgi:hypothetical protein